MSKLRGIGVLLIILVIIALPFVSFYEGYNGDVYVENNYQYAKDTIVNLDAADSNIEKIKITNDEIGDPEEYVYEIFQNDVPLGLLEHVEVQDPISEYKSEYNEIENVEVVKNDSEVFASMENDTVQETSLAIIEELVVNETISDTINDDIIPLSNTINAYANYEYPSWILGEQDSTIQPETILDVVVPANSYAVQETKEEVFDIVAAAEEENIENGFYNISSIITDETAVASMQDTKDVFDDVIQNDEIPLASGINHYEYVVQAKNDEVKQFMRMMGISNEDENTIEDDILPEGSGTDSSNFNTDLDINILYDVSSKLTTYELPIYYIEMIDGVPCEKFSTFIVIK